MDLDPVYYTPIFIPSLYLILILALFLKKQKSDQFRIFFDIQDRVDRNLYELREVYRNLNKPKTQKT